MQHSRANYFTQAFDIRGRDTEQVSAPASSVELLDEFRGKRRNGDQDHGVRLAVDDILDRVSNISGVLLLSRACHQGQPALLGGIFCSPQAGFAERIVFVDHGNAFGAQSGHMAHDGIDFFNIAGAQVENGRIQRLAQQLGAS